MEGCGTLATSSKKAECMKIKTIIDGIWKEMEGKKARKEDSPSLIKYSSDVLLILQEIHIRRND